MLHQLLLTDGAALMEHQVLQNARLLAGEGQRLPVGAGRPGAGVEGQAAAGEQHVLLGELPQGQTADAGLQLRQMEGLCQIVVGAGVQPLHLVRHLAAGGEDQHRRLPVRLPQRPQHCHAVLFRQVQIQQHQIVPLCI